MRHWLLTSTTYGTWLPGDERGFVGRVWDVRPEDVATDSLRREHDQFGQPYDAHLPGLRRESQRLMKGTPVWLNAEQADSILAQFLETSTFRGWVLHAASIMSNHFHAIVEALDAVRSDDILGDLKSYASRRLNKAYSKPSSGTWWTASGSKRPLREIDRLSVLIRYVLNQHRFLARWLHPQYGPIDAFLSGGRQPTVEPAKVAFLSGGHQPTVEPAQVIADSHGGQTTREGDKEWGRRRPVVGFGSLQDGLVGDAQLPFRPSDAGAGECLAAASGRRPSPSPSRSPCRERRHHTRSA